MRRADREIKDPEKIAEILDRAKILHLGLNDDGCPYVVPLHYGCERGADGLTFYMHCAKEGHKLDLIRRDPRACVELECDVGLIPGDEACRYSAAYASLMARGTAEIVEDRDEKIRALRRLMKNQTGRDFEITPQMAESVAIIKFTAKEFSAKGKPAPEAQQKRQER